MTECDAFRIWGAIYAWTVFILWIYIVVRSLYEQIRQEITFFRPTPPTDTEKCSVELTSENMVEEA